PTITAVRSGEAELSRITGAKTPSGIPVTITPPAAEPPRRAASGGSASARGRRGRTTRGRTTGKHRTT
ncbi:ATP-dependent helicase, partial [Streptomyces sp. NPDC047043]